MHQIIGRVGFVMVGSAQKCRFVLYNMFCRTNLFLLRLYSNLPMLQLT